MDVIRSLEALKDYPASEGQAITKTVRSLLEESAPFRYVRERSDVALLQQY